VAVVHKRWLREEIAQAVPKAAYCAPSGTLLRAFSTRRAGFASQGSKAGNSARRSRASRRPPSISAPCRRQARRRRGRTRSAQTARRVSGLSGLVLDDADEPPGRTTRRISLMKCAHSEGATWCKHKDCGHQIASRRRRRESSCRRRRGSRRRGCRRAPCAILAEETSIPLRRPTMPAAARDESRRRRSRRRAWRAFPARAAARSIRAAGLPWLA